MSSWTMRDQITISSLGLGEMNVFFRRFKLWGDQTMLPPKLNSSVFTSSITSTPLVQCLGRGTWSKPAASRESFQGNQHQTALFRATNYISKYFSLQIPSRPVFITPFPFPKYIILSLSLRGPCSFHAFPLNKVWHALSFPSKSMLKTPFPLSWYFECSQFHCS